MYLGRSVLHQSIRCIEGNRRKTQGNWGLGARANIRKYSSSRSLAGAPQGSSFTPVKGFRDVISIELLWPGEETKEDTELEKRVCPLAEKRETAGETGVDDVVVNGD
jgi:hypothetical protein